MYIYVSLYKISLFKTCSPLHTHNIIQSLDICPLNLMYENPL